MAWKLNSNFILKFKVRRKRNNFIRNGENRDWTIVIGVHWAVDYFYLSNILNISHDSEHFTLWQLFDKLHSFSFKQTIIKLACVFLLCVLFFNWNGNFKLNHVLTIWFNQPKSTCCITFFILSLRSLFFWSFKILLLFQICRKSSMSFFYYLL